MAKLHIIDSGNTTADAIEIHGKNCADVTRKLQNIFIIDQGEIVGDTMKEIWEDYNSDFIAEGGPEDAWDLTFFPCTKFVTRKTVFQG